jgi:hypothetical protein
MEICEAWNVHISVQQVNETEQKLCDMCSLQSYA